MLGDPAVGKTSLVKRFVEGTFDEKYLSTIGTTIYKKTMNIGPKNLRLMIWDIFGQMTEYKFHSPYFKKAKAFLLVCDLTKESTIESMPKWVESLYDEVGVIPGVIIANKSDLVYKKVNPSVLKMTEKLSLPHVITSAKSGKNVEKAFSMVSELIIERGEK